MVWKPQQQEFQAAEHFASKAKRQRVVNADTRHCLFFFSYLNKVQSLNSRSCAEWTDIPTSRQARLSFVVIPRSLSPR